MEERNYTVYKHTTPSGKVYVGITRKKNPEDRWKSGVGYRKNKYFYRAILKYGWDNIEHEILRTNLTRKEAQEMEIALIWLYDATNVECGYNLTSGGEARKVYSEEARRHMSEANKATYANGREGNKATKVVQFSVDGERLGEFASARKAAIAVGMTTESCTHISACCRGLHRTVGGFVWRYEGDDFNKYPVCKLENPRKIPVDQYSLDGKFVRSFSCASEAEDKTGISRRNILDAIKKSSKKSRITAGGFIWRRKGDSFDSKETVYTPKGRSVEQCDLFGNTLRQFRTISEAEEMTGASHIKDVCKGTRKTSGGYVWRYVEVFQMG